MCDYSAVTNECTCPHSECPRHKKCCECIAFHRKKKSKVPFCIKDIEWTEQWGA